MPRLQIPSANGPIAANHATAPDADTLVVIAPGHNGFFNYGMFPAMQQRFADAGVDSLCLNYSHSGIEGEADTFTDLARYAKNCVRLEVEDLLAVLAHAAKQLGTRYKRTFVLGHSLGGAVVAFAMGRNPAVAATVAGLILLNPVTHLAIWPQAMMEEWATTGTYLKHNNRTGQHLPQGHELLNEMQQAATTWNVQAHLRQVQTPTLVLHGDADEAIPLAPATTFYQELEAWHPSNQVIILPGASHTLGTGHPAPRSTPHLEAAMGAMLAWMAQLPAKAA